MKLYTDKRGLEKPLDSLKNVGIPKQEQVDINNTHVNRNSKGIRVQNYKFEKPKATRDALNIFK
ncbi:MAG: hypothetical protein HQK84_03270 [Nitrospinae bacterium]|nr:hypothetical protein [Nitrospinota bacterium]